MYAMHIRIRTHTHTGQDVPVPGMHEDDSYNFIVDKRDKMPRLTGIVYQWLVEFGQEVNEGTVVVSKGCVIRERMMGPVYTSMHTYMHIYTTHTYINAR